MTPAKTRQLECFCMCLDMAEVRKPGSHWKTQGMNEGVRNQKEKNICNGLTKWLENGKATHLRRGTNDSTKWRRMIANTYKKETTETQSGLIDDN